LTVVCGALHVSLYEVLPAGGATVMRIPVANWVTESQVTPFATGRAYMHQGTIVTISSFFVDHFTTTIYIFAVNR
jgi:hypothetical protein